MRWPIITVTGTRGEYVPIDLMGGTPLRKGHHVRTPHGLLGPFTHRSNAVVVAELATTELEVLEEPRAVPLLFLSDGPGIVYLPADKELADYYGDDNRGYPWINPRLVDFADERGLLWDWVNVGVIGLFR